jgi:hypothetical protein
VIVSGLFGAMNGFFGWVMSLLGGIHLPDWAQQLQDALSTCSTYLSGLGVWVNWPLAVTVGAVVLNVYLACLIVKVVLRIVAFLPMIGGAG